MARVLLDQPQSLTERPENFKPLDFGANGINGSLDWNGRIIALNWYHPQHGYVTLTSADPFHEDQRYNPSAVRAYRAGLAQLEGFGLVFDDPILKREVIVGPSFWTTLVFTFEDNSTARVSTFVHGNLVVQVWQSDKKQPRWAGKISLQRCAYTQLTEGGPIPQSLVSTQASIKDGLIVIKNPVIGSKVNIWGLPKEERFEREEFGPINILFENNVMKDSMDLLDSGSYLINGPYPGFFQMFVYDFSPENTDIRIDSYKSPRGLTVGVLLELLDKWHERWHGIEDELLLRRGLFYAVRMAVPVNHGICIITDHMLLPLSWNRDAYYVARALLSWTKEMHDIVRRHLIWMFEIAERLGGVWGRCYLANGRQKDPAFQLDQQLWPLLEFAEYVQETGDHATFERLQSQVSTILDTLLARRKNPDGWLFPTDETPADDPIALPYHLSSHILFWRTLMKLANVFSGDSEKQKTFLMWADHIRAAIQQSFVAEHPPFGPIYAYATDGEGHFHFYHDANDFPLVLAPIWKFCGADDPVWRATIQFAWSPENEGGYYAGRLGSVHTRAAWPLGDVQELIVAQVLGDADREKKARENLMSAAQWDGALPEAVDPITNAVVSRHWFAWPNAALACVELETFQLQG
ncbi:MAG: glycoside hydrolase family 125 protein [Anaerolineae bacterium]|nr:glycoside hydrolase family 125 protein [Anaerolineae bacterium]